MGEGAARASGGNVLAGKLGEGAARASGARGPGGEIGGGGQDRRKEGAEKDEGIYRSQLDQTLFPGAIKIRRVRRFRPKTCIPQG